MNAPMGGKIRMVQLETLMDHLEEKTVKNYLGVRGHKTKAWKRDGKIWSLSELREES